MSHIACRQGGELVAELLSCTTFCLGKFALGSSRRVLTIAAKNGNSNLAARCHISTERWIRFKPLLLPEAELGVVSARFSSVQITQTLSQTGEGALGCSGLDSYKQAYWHALNWE